MDSQGFAVGIADVEAAATRLEGQLVRTRLIESEALNARYDARILFKPKFAAYRLIQVSRRL